MCAAVQAIQDKASGFAVQIAGWTDGNGDYLMQIIRVISGYAFYDIQTTSQGEAASAATPRGASSSAGRRCRTRSASG